MTLFHPRAARDRRRRACLGLVCLLVVLCLALLAAAFSEQLAPNDPYAQDLSRALEAPGPRFPLGTDRYGRCLFSRVLVGAKTTVFSALALVGAVTGVGTAVGVLCGYVGGRVDALIMRISDVFLAFPGMVFAIAVAGVLGGGMPSAVLALAFISWPKYARVARSQVLSVKNAPFLAAARLGGCTPAQMIFVQILPNILGPITVTAALDIGVMIMELAGLSFLGLGAAPPTAEWGSMMSGGRSMLQTAPWVVLAPGCAIFLTVMLFNLLGDSVRDVLDPRYRK